jgi:hypothetical protein
LELILKHEEPVINYGNIAVNQKAFLLFHNFNPGHVFNASREKLNVLPVESARKLFIVVFWVVTPCGLISGYQRFGETYHLHLQGDACGT